MATSGRPRQQPSTVVELLAWAISDSRRTARFIAIAGCLLGVVVFSITVGVTLVVMATEGIRGVHPRYLLPAGIVAAAPLLTWITIVIRVGFTRRKRRRASGKEPPGTP